MYKCVNCKENFNLDEMVGLNYNDEMVDTNEQALELNAQNPDYCVKWFCENCAEEKGYI